MDWVKFSTDTCPQKQRMLFLDETDMWYEAEFLDDAEYGFILSTVSSYMSIEGITHYMVIDTNTTT